MPPRREQLDLTVIPIDSYCPVLIRDRKPCPLPPGIFFYIVSPYLMTHDVLVQEHHVGEPVLTHLIRWPERLRPARPPGPRDRVMPVMTRLHLTESRLNRASGKDRN